MKTLKKAFLPMLGLGLLASCSNDNLDGPNKPSTSGDDVIYMSLQISQKPATRTSTTATMPEETGQSFENAIKQIKLLFLDENQDIVKKVIDINSTNWTITGATTGNNAGNYTAVGKVDRSEMEALVASGDVTFRIFVVCNPYTNQNIPDASVTTAWTSAPTDKLSGNGDAALLASIGSNLADVTNSRFQMTNADAVSESDGTSGTLGTPILPTIKLEQAKIKGTSYTDISDPLRLPLLQVQRNVARFDYAYDESNTTKYTTFRYPESASSDEEADVVITLEDMALVNIAKEFNLFKQVGVGSGTAAQFTTPSSWSYFKPEWYTTASDNENRVVFNPQYDKMKSIVASTPSGDPATYFAYPYFANTSGTYSVKKMQKAENNFAYTPIATIYATNYTGTEVTKDNPSGTTQELVNRGYKFWCYATPNTIHDPAEQKKGISTGVIFRAKLTSSKENSALKNAIAANSSEVVNQTVYAYGNTIYGTFDDLKTYVSTEANKSNADFVTISSTYGDAKEKLAGKDETEANMHDLLKANGYKIYRWEGEAGTGGFYCYYTYWNQHDNNYLDGEMGIMEFGVVRNNIYKLAVTSIAKLGHPGDPDDDPDPDDPGDKDETKEMYMQVECQVIPWTVRQNDIKF